MTSTTTVCERPYVSWEGLQRAARDFTGRETMGIGIRPFGFHAGNMASIVAYPILLCEQMQAIGKEPAFDIHCFFNDVEQHGIIGHETNPDGDDEANIYPADTTLQYTSGPPGFEGSLVDYWSPLIANGVTEIRKRFPGVRIAFHTTSSLRTTPEFVSAVTTSLSAPDKIADILEEKTGRKVYRPAEYMRAVCQGCFVPVRHTRLDADKKIDAPCQLCGTENKGKISQFDYWVHHAVLTLPKLAVGKGFDLWMMGYDHIQYNETPTRLKLSELFGIRARNYVALHAPLIISYDGNKMGKSNGNQAYVELPELLETLRQNTAHSVSIATTKHSPDITILGKLLPAHIRNLKM